MSASFYLHGSLLGEGDHKVLPLPVLFHHMGKDDMPIATGPSQLGAVCRPGQGEHTACVGLLQCIGPLDQARREQIENNMVNGYRSLSTILNNYLGEA